VTDEEAVAAIVGEALERYCSNFYRHDSLKFGSFSDLHNEAVESSSWVLYSDKQYNQNVSIRCTITG
jgi:YcaO cyclodehydratase, ATP-ad Mg2+-binding